MCAVVGTVWSSSIFNTSKTTIPRTHTNTHTHTHTHSLSLSLFLEGTPDGPMVVTSFQDTADCGSCTRTSNSSVRLSRRPSRCCRGGQGTPTLVEFFRTSSGMGARGLGTDSSCSPSRSCSTTTTVSKSTMTRRGPTLALRSRRSIVRDVFQSFLLLSSRRRGNYFTRRQHSQPLCSIIRSCHNMCVHDCPRRSHDDPLVDANAQPHSLQVRMAVCLECRSTTSITTSPTATSPTTCSSSKSRTIT